MSYITDQKSGIIHFEVSFGMCFNVSSHLMQSSAITSWFFRIIISVENIASFFLETVKSCNCTGFSICWKLTKVDKEKHLFEVGFLHNNINVFTATFI